MTTIKSPTPATNPPLARQERELIPSDINAACEQVDAARDGVRHQLAAGYHDPYVAWRRIVASV